MKIKKLLPTNIKFVGNKIKYANLCLAVDLECTSFYENGEKRAIPYICGLAINEKFTCFRSLNKFIKNLNYIALFYNCSNEKRIIIYVHNLRYDIQFIFKYFEWANIFANSPHNIFYAVTKNGIEFRDSLLLSGASLDATAKSFECPVKKLVGDLDYDLIRSPLTKLEKQEYLYLRNDCLIINYYIRHLLKLLKCNLASLPLTKTGIVREDVRSYCLNSKKYKKTIKLLTLSGAEEYKALKNAFQGGFTHANAKKVGETVEDVKSFDFTSSYPSVMLLEKYPMSKAKFTEKITLEDLEKLTKSNCVIFTIDLTNLVKKVSFESFLSVSKCLKLVNGKTDNGRLTRADYVSITLTNLDFEIMQKMYTFNILKIYNVYSYKKGYLPVEFKQKILEFYRLKTELKGIEGKETTYALNKEKVNALYGMTVMDLVQEEYEENTDELQEDFLKKCDIEELETLINKYNKNHNRFLFYPWGIFITAYARYNLFSGILNIKNDYIYADTDSIKLENYDKHIKYFSNYNQNIIEKIKKVCNEQKLNINDFMPETIKGEKKIIGVWDEDGTYDYFKTLGAKRYMYKSGEKFSLTISGVNKKSAIPFLLEKFNNNYDVIFNYFTENRFLIPATYINKNGEKTHPCGKLTVTYSTELIKGCLKDYQNNYYNYEQHGFVHMEPATFGIKECTSLLDFLTDCEESENGIL